jgi:hypothetical protein
MDYVMDSYCGLYCGACPNLLAAKAGTGKKPCHGCKSEQPTGYCLTCTIKACASQRGLEFCYECSEFAGCEQIHKFAEEAGDQLGVFNNFESIKIEGLPKWLEEQGNHWRCENCGASHSWLAKSCSQCGQLVTNNIVH